MRPDMPVLGRLGIVVIVGGVPGMLFGQFVSRTWMMDHFGWVMAASGIIGMILGWHRAQEEDFRASQCEQCFAEKQSCRACFWSTVAFVTLPSLLLGAWMALTSLIPICSTSAMTVSYDGG